MAKHMSDGGSDVAVGRGLTSTLLEDSAGWAQAVLMALPAIGYGLIYFARFQKYTWLGISPSLITVRLEDVLLVVVLTVIIAWVVMLNSIQALWTEKRWRVLAMRIILPVLISLIFFQGCGISTEVIKYDTRSWPTIILLVVQIVLLVFTCKQLGRAFPKSHHQGAKVVCALLCFTLLCCINVAYFSCHRGQYQYVREDKAIIVGFDSQGKAIEKEIVEISDKYICKLESGYQLTDVSDKDISIVQFGHVTVEAVAEPTVEQERADAS